MLKVDWSDVLGVLQTFLPYRIGIAAGIAGAAAIAAAVTVAAAKRKKH